METPFGVGWGGTLVGKGPDDWGETVLTPHPHLLHPLQWVSVEI